MASFPLFDQRPDADRPDPTHLRDHLRQCTGAMGRMHRLKCAAESIDAFLAPRFVTTLALLTMIVIGGVSLPA